MPLENNGRKRREPSASGGVYKRGDGLHTGRVGNADYSERNERRTERSFNGSNASGFPGGTGGMHRMSGRGGRGHNRLITLLVVIFIVIYAMNSCSEENDTAYTQASGTWHTPVTTYEDTNDSEINEMSVKGAREKYTLLKGNGSDQVTMLVYMIGTDLESNYGMATSDLNEMSYAAHSDKVNILVETGGSKKWRNNIVSNRTLQRWKVGDKSLQTVDQRRSAQMTDPDTLEDFLSWGKENYPADRYILVLWDHGGGSLTGYGYDELYPNGSMSLDEVASAVKQSGLKFDFIGFDACLMANAEAAYALEPYADYLIASEETEPGTGWYYTDWLTSLAKNSSLDTVHLGKEIVDDFISSSPDEKTSLSVIDLAQFKAAVPEKLKNFSTEISKDIDSDNYAKVASARNNTKEFASGNDIDQIDLVHFAKNMESTAGNELTDAVQSCVKYNRVNNMTNAYGLSIYFPYRNTRSVSTADGIYKNIDMPEEYSAAVRSFASLEASGQVTSGNSQSSLFDLLSGSSPSASFSYDTQDILNLLLSGESESSQSYGGYSGYQGSGLDLFSLLGGNYYDERALDGYAQYVGRNHVDSSLLSFSNVNGNTVLSLPQSQWDQIQNIALNVWADDGSGYIDLGMDNIFDFDEDGNLLADYDGTWLSLNDHLVSWYITEQSKDVKGNDITEGYVPALLNGEQVNILIRFDKDHEYGTVLGAQKKYSDGMEAKGLIPIETGDQIDYLCDYYTYDGDYEDTYYLGESYTVEGELTVGTYQITDTDLKYGYRLTDLYHANHWTQMLDY